MLAKNKKLLLLLPVVALCALLFFFFLQEGVFTHYSAEELRDWVEQFSPWSEVVFFCLQFLSVIVAPIPSNITAAAGGLLFGAPVSFLLTFSAVLLGSCTAFQLARVLGQRRVQRILSQKLSLRYQDVLRRKRDTFLALAFLFPLFPDDILCFLAGVTDIPFPRFVVLILLFRPWGLFASSLLGGTALSLPQWAVPVLLTALGFLFAIGCRYGDLLEEKILRRFER